MNRIRRLLRIESPKNTRLSRGVLPAAGALLATIVATTAVGIAAPQDHEVHTRHHARVTQDRGLNDIDQEIRELQERIQRLQQLIANETQVWVEPEEPVEVVERTATRVRVLRDGEWSAPRVRLRGDAVVRVAPERIAGLENRWRLHAEPAPEPRVRARWAIRSEPAPEPHPHVTWEVHPEAAPEPHGDAHEVHVRTDSRFPHVRHRIQGQAHTPESAVPRRIQLDLMAPIEEDLHEILREHFSDDVHEEVMELLNKHLRQGEPHVRQRVERLFTPGVRKNETVRFPERVRWLRRDELGAAWAVFRKEAFHGDGERFDIELELVDEEAPECEVEIELVEEESLIGELIELEQ